jgi:hypothetical protein
MRFKMGLFDPAPNPYKTIGLDVVGSLKHQAMSLNAARKGMVLLKKGVRQSRLLAGSVPASFASWVCASLVCFRGVCQRR